MKTIHRLSNEGMPAKSILGLLVGCLAVLFSHCSTDSPIPIDGLQLWLRADAGVALNGSTVSRWVDQSGNGNDAIQLDAPRQPLLVRNALNSLPALHFDGIEDKLALTGTALMSQLSLFLVLKLDSGATGPNPNYPIVLGDADAKGREFSLGMQFEGTRDSSDLIFVGAGPGIGVRATVPDCAAFGRWNSISVTANQTIWSTTLRANGVNASIREYGNNMFLSVPLGGPTAAGVGGVGGTDGIPLYPGRAVAKCDIAEVIVYDTVLSDSLRRVVEQYLGTKYNLPSVKEVGE